MKYLNSSKKCLCAFPGSEIFANEEASVMEDLNVENVCMLSGFSLDPF